MIQNQELVSHRNLGRQQVADGADDAFRGEVALGVVVTTDDEDAWVVALGLYNQVMKELEIVVVSERRSRPSRIA